jgi:hypothetical protein
MKPQSGLRIVMATVVAAFVAAWLTPQQQLISAVPADDPSAVAFMLR